MSNERILLLDICNNKKAFIELDEVNPFAVLLAVVGGFFAYFITGNPFGVGGSENVVNGISMFWRVASGLVTTVVCFIVVSAMAD